MNIFILLCALIEINYDTIIILLNELINYKIVKFNLK